MSLAFKDANGRAYPKWEEKKIGDFYQERKEKTGVNPELLSVTINDGVKRRCDLEGKDSSNPDKSKYKDVYKGDMVYNSMRMWQGASGISAYDGITSPAYTVLYPKVKLDNYFMSCLFKLPKSIKYFERFSQGLTSDQWNLKYPQLSKLKLQIPTLPEQRKIADFFSAVDEKIALAKSALETAKALKKASLQRLFSGELAFTDAGKPYPKWEEKRLGEVCEVTAGGDIKKENVSQVKTAEFCYPVYANSLKDNGLYGYTNTFKIEKDTVTVTARGNIGVAIARFEKYYPIVRLLILHPNENISPKFLEEAINNANIILEASGVPQLTAPQIKLLKLQIPTLPEQRKIADFFSEVDKKISLKEKKLSTLNSLKKAFLQQIFN